MAILFGDTSNSLSGKQHGGNQDLIGLDPTNTIFGDAALDLLNHAVGGDDTLTALIPFANNHFFGDAGGNMSDHTAGGE
jgi:hypothetical protein